jgi:hypothetical protein
VLRVAGDPSALANFPNKGHIHREFFRI